MTLLSMTLIIDPTERLVRSFVPPPARGQGANAHVSAPEPRRAHHYLTTSIFGRTNSNFMNENNKGDWLR
jgi:hypothetical protein